MAIKNLTVEAVRAALSYDKETGLFERKRPSAGRKSGSSIGTMASDGYIKICVCNTQVAAHRLAWLIVTGEWPRHEIDHIDGNRSNNKLSNLRDVTTSMNQQNQRRAQSTNVSGLLGVHRTNSLLKPWMARIKPPNQKVKYLGSFATTLEAHQAYLCAKRDMHSGCTL